ncbi:MAG: bifunctional diaminohydroxyphosphoribosylaminopyrimidine deaminase/5-amino-6-(5-phosphoribosylamino)uracil reductase RibD, partial [Planctomycetaceae bacterium]
YRRTLTTFYMDVCPEKVDSVDQIIQKYDHKMETLFVTLEPCRHTGKTPPCTQAIRRAGIERVVIGTRDPADHNSGRGISELQHAGLEVQTGFLESEARQLIAPFAMLQTERRPWVHAKWAMSLDGKLATHSGHSQWISDADSRRHVHQLRGRMDAILVGARTAQLDDPMLTARPPGPRTPLRVVMDRLASMPLDSQLVRTAHEIPVVVFAGHAASDSNVARLRQSGVEVLQLDLEGSHSASRAAMALQELGRRNLTHVLVEGGGVVLGAFRDAGLIDEVHVFVAPKLIGGLAATTPMAGAGLASVPQSAGIELLSVQRSGQDIYLQGRVCRSAPNQQPGTDQGPAIV